MSLTHIKTAPSRNLDSFLKPSQAYLGQTANTATIPGGNSTHGINRIWPRWGDESFSLGPGQTDLKIGKVSAHMVQLCGTVFATSDTLLSSILQPILRD